MTESEYIEQRLEDQINWYSNKSSACQNRYKTLRIIEIVAASIIPFLSGFGDKILYSPWIIGSLGVTIAISTTISSLFKFHENWIQYRSTSEALKHEKYLFLAQASPYGDANSYQVFVQRVEGLISNENSTWIQAVKAAKTDASKD